MSITQSSLEEIPIILNGRWNSSVMSEIWTNLTRTLKGMLLILAHVKETQSVEAEIWNWDGRKIETSATP